MRSKLAYIITCGQGTHGTDEPAHPNPDLSYYYERTRQNFAEKLEIIKAVVFEDAK